jgi:branched-chain amino acid transport system substrate-binding protein
LRVKDAKPDALFGFPGGGPSAISMIKQFNTSGLKASMKLVGTADLVSDELLNAEADDAVGVSTVSNYTADHSSKLNQTFVRAYRAALTNPTPEDVPSFIAVQAFDALTLIDKMVAAQKGPLDAARSMAILRGITIESPRGMLSFDPQTREVRQTMYIRQVQELTGRYANVEIASFPPAKSA